MNLSRGQQIKSEFGQQLKKVREAQGMTKEELANKADISRSQIYRIETGKINPRLTTITLIAETLGMEVWELLKKN